MKAMFEFWTFQKRTSVLHQRRRCLSFKDGFFVRPRNEAYEGPSVYRLVRVIGASDEDGSLGLNTSGD